MVLVWEGKATTDLTPLPRDILGKGVAVAQGSRVAPGPSSLLSCLESLPHPAPDRLAESPAAQTQVVIPLPLPNAIPPTLPPPACLPVSVTVDTRGSLSRPENGK